MSLIGAAAHLISLLRNLGHASCLVGGLAVSTRCDPRFTRDADIAVAVDSDAQAEAIGRALVEAGYRLDASVEQEAVGRLAMLRVVDTEGTNIDLLFASSGIETEMVKESEILEVARGVRLPVARVGHLIALKLLSFGPGRETDTMDLRNLAAIAEDEEWERAQTAGDLIEERGYDRGREIGAALTELRRG